MLHPYARWHFGPTPDAEALLPSEDAEEHAVAVLDDPALFASWGPALVTLTGMHWRYVRANDTHAAQWDEEDLTRNLGSPHGGPYRAHWTATWRLWERSAEVRAWVSRGRAVWEIVDLGPPNRFARHFVDLHHFVDHQLRASLAVHRAHAGAASFPD